MFNSTSEQTNMGKDHLLAAAISTYRTSVGNTELSPPAQHNPSPYNNSMTHVTVSFPGVTGTKPCHGLSPKLLALRIACVTETILVLRKRTLLY
ncbi:hypothetical protein TNCV_361271 [Trichonephila clavipes]|nr:hypothetical protein TNCV_361271 [Trichonephila clavipes]